MEINARFSERLHGAGLVLPSSRPLQELGPGHSPALEGAVGLCGASAARVSTTGEVLPELGQTKAGPEPWGAKAEGGGEVQKHTHRTGPGQGRERALSSLAPAAV